MKIRMRKIAATCSAVIMVGVVAMAAAESATATPIRSVTLAQAMASRPSPGPTCGGVRPAKPGGGRYTCTFTDDFNGSTLDTSKWTATDTSTNGFTTGYGSATPDCYTSDPRNVSVSGGYLHLTSRVEASSFLCHSPYGDFTTNKTAGAVVSWGKFAQTYGRFEFRAKFPSNSGSDFDSALWMHPQNQIYGAWPKSGEIDVAEWFGDGYGTNPVFPSVHYAGEDKTKSTGRKCVVPGAATQYHNYAVNWTATTMYFYYDNTLCFQHSWTPDAPLVAPQPFDQAFNLVMTQTGGYNRPAGTNVTLDLDWVRAWK